MTDDPPRPSAAATPGGEIPATGEGWPADDDAPPARGPRLPALSARALVCFVLGFVGMYATLVAFGVFGVPALLLLIVLGLAGAFVEPRRSGFGWAVAGVAACFVLETALYLQVREPADAGYDALAPVVVIGGTALAAFLIGSGWLLRRLLSDNAPDVTTDG